MVLKFVRIYEACDLLDTFLARAGTSQRAFRYFATRETSVVKRHLCTIIGVKDRVPVSYGHLDVDAGRVWLGICVAEHDRGKGYGTQTMAELTRNADELGVERVDLAVDIDNVGAQRMYAKFGFEPGVSKNGVVYMVRRLP